MCCLRHTYFATLLSLLLALLPARAYAQQVIFVDSAATGQATGTSWTDAYPHLQDALAVAKAGNELWVAQGTYRPDQGDGMIAGDRTASFPLKPGVALYGGFTGTETNLDARDVAAHRTILSGDLLGNDTDSLNLEAPSRSENSFHVVVAGAEIDTTTVLDGFTITAGHANDAPPTNNHTGGGLQNSGGSPVVRNVTFVSNAAEFGGGLYSSGGEPVLSDVAFDGNFADTGGGMYSFRSNVRLTEVIFRGNIASAGGGMYNRSGSEQVTNALFIQNTASGSGGGMFNRKGEQTVVNSAFLGNKAGSGGGGMLSDESNTTLTNVVFSSNTAGEGGGIFSNLNEDDDRLLVTNVTLSGNTASTQGGGIYNLFGGAVIANSILWDNTATAEGDHIFDRDNTSTVVHSLVEGGLPHGTIDGGGNLTSDPLFVNTAGPDGVPGTEDDDLRIQENSPAIDAGDNSALPSDSLDLDQDGDTTEVLPVDLDFHVRVYDGGSGEAVVDMGAYEFDAPPVRIDIEAPEIEVPGQLIRWNVYPNPFREQTTLHFTLRRSSPVEVALYNAVGRRIRTLYRGTAVARQVHRVQVDGRGLPSGIYLVRLSGAGITASQAMVLIR